MKTCSKCKIEKEVTEFYARRDGKLESWCKSCCSEAKLKPKGTKWKVSLREQGKKHCGKCKEVKLFTEFGNNKKTFDKYQTRCKACKSESDKKYCENNKEMLKNKKIKYYQKNKSKYREYGKNRVRDYKKEYSDVRKNPLKTLKYILRNRTSIAFKYRGYKKNTKTQEMLGVSWEICKAHIERQFTKRMNWSNYGEWHIDHIIPLGSAKTEEEIIKLCHYSNLQPLWAFDNLSKSDKIIGQQNKLRL